MTLKGFCANAWEFTTQPLQRCDIALMALQVMLVAVHPWDCNGAKAAGLKAAFIARKGENYPDFFTAPDYSAKCLEDLAQQLRA